MPPPERPPPFPRRELSGTAWVALWTLRAIVLVLIAMTVYSFVRGLG